MKSSSPLLLFALVCAWMPAYAAETECAVPRIPTYSRDADCVARVEREVREWRLCVAAYRASHDNPELAKLDREVEARMDKWLVSTRTVASGESERQRLLNRIERDRSQYLAQQRASGRIVYATERK